MDRRKLCAGSSGWNRTRWLLGLSALLALGFATLGEPANAGGLLGDVFRAVGNATGIQPISDVGNKLDDEHRNLKNHNPDYKRLEEEATRFARLPQTLACVQAFEAIAQPIKISCNGFMPASLANPARDSLMIEMAKMELIQAGLATPSDFAGVSIRWCNGNIKGAGVVPNSEEVLLNRSLQSYNWSVAEALAHELVHLRQYRRMGTDNFKCDYALKFAAYRGCQDRGHPLEREAYEFGDLAAERLTERGYQYVWIESSPSGKVASYRFAGAILLDGAHSAKAAKPVFPSVDETAARIAWNACSASRNMNRYDAMPCGAQMEVLLAEIGEAVRTTDMILTPALKAQLVEATVEELQEICQSASTTQDEAGPGANASVSIVAAAACVQAGKAYFSAI